MAEFRLKLYRDHLGAKVTLDSLPALNRVLYVVAGVINVSSGEAAAMLGANCAWFSANSCSITSSADGASVLRYELCESDRTVALEETEGHSSELLFDTAVDLQPDQTSRLVTGYIGNKPADLIDFGAVAPAGSVKSTFTSAR